MSAEITMFVLAGFSGMMAGSIPGFLFLADKRMRADSRFCLALLMLYLLGMTWALVELLGRPECSPS